MIANAGIVKIAPLLDLSTEIIDLTHSINVKGVFYCYRAAARAMIPSGGGRIIGACSVGGKTTQEWAEYGITVNAYAPGPINTEMWLKNVISASDTGPILDQKATELSATHKKSTPEQVAGLVSFLLSPAADNMTGQCISIDGGWNMD
ncbi:unnamed protein product [Rhizoctonia solani]|uniref:3-oxoacyl-[acyl-carrier-protein] reductase n=1 Tax=Rhizoctonia solani TaxID=456999 RepID=A0A8H2W796_9AGAM|nr:unnamed protein product [Rhizoctonia solani]